MKKYVMALVVLFGMLFASSAMATSVTTTISPLGTTYAGDHMIADFDSVGSSLMSGNYDIVQGNGSSFAAPGHTDTTKYLVTPGTGGSGVSSLDLSGQGRLRYISWDQGSNDSYGYASFFGEAGNLIVSFAGSVFPPANGDQTSALTNFNVRFDFGTLTKFSRIEFGSNGIANEIDNVAAGVPEPASWALMIVGFGLIGVTARRRHMADGMVRVVA
jgi:hypothetical protein